MAENPIEIQIEESNPMGEEATQLLREMRVEAIARYGDVIDVSAPPPINEPLIARSAFLIARSAVEAVGCAALRPIDPQTAEIRRMYVTSSVRRRGVGRRLLQELESQAALFGFATLRLETGNRQPEAIALYESCGFRRIAAYGSYVKDPLSICFEKEVAGGPNS